jgi:hypothetical protein
MPVYSYLFGHSISTPADYNSALYSMNYLESRNPKFNEKNLTEEMPIITFSRV